MYLAAYQNRLAKKGSNQYVFEMGFYFKQPGTSVTIIELIFCIFTYGKLLDFQTDIEEESFTSQDLVDTAPSAGYDDIKKLIKESKQRIVCVRAGKWYEDHVKAVEVRLIYRHSGHFDVVVGIKCQIYNFVDL